MSKKDRLFEVNLRRLALLVLPTWWRRPLLGSLAFAAMSAPSRFTLELKTFRKEKNYRLRHNGQVCKLRGVLNDEFDPEQRRITIEDSGSSGNEEASTVYQREVGRWVILPLRGYGAGIIHRQGYAGTSGYDFWVNIPGELHDGATETRIKAIINTYKLASKRYAINFI